eukprot:11270054-Alexandrium_andersonii.AAC.1
MALESRSLMTRTVRDASLPSFVRKQLSIATSGTACSPGRALARGTLDTRPRTQCAHHDRKGTW